jgi:phosphatidylserine/phosphatidylglycerophosphate/cardiolipin synthase-like enzyme
VPNSTGRAPKERGTACQVRWLSFDRLLSAAQIRSVLIYRLVAAHGAIRSVTNTRWSHRQMAAILKRRNFLRPVPANGRIPAEIELVEAYELAGTTAGRAVGGLVRRGGTRLHCSATRCIRGGTAR